jgi:hypothetical protein
MNNPNRGDGTSNIAGPALKLKTRRRDGPMPWNLHALLSVHGRRTSSSSSPQRRRLFLLATRARASGGGGEVLGPVRPPLANPPSWVVPFTRVCVASPDPDLIARRRSVGWFVLVYTFGWSVWSNGVCRLVGGCPLFLGLLDCGWRGPSDFFYVRGRASEQRGRRVRARPEYEDGIQRDL